MRWWNDVVAAWSDHVPLRWTVLGLLALSAAGGWLWMTWPASSPRRWRWPSRRARRPDRPPVTVPITEVDLAEAENSSEELPELAPEVFATLADRYAAQGRWAEAVRERLRAIVRSLVDHGVIEPQPGWTVLELAQVAGSARPTVAGPVAAASDVFSRIWYARRPALPEHDAQMRQHATAVRDDLDGERR